MNFLHLAPLALIMFIIVAPKVFNLLMGKNYEGKLNHTLILVLSSIGILAGTYDHHHVCYLIDPCFGYAAALVYVAFKVAVLRPVKETVSK